MSSNDVEPNKDCFYYDKVFEELSGEDGCCQCFECAQSKCPVAISRMTEDEKKFFCINE